MLTFIMRNYSLAVKLLAGVYTIGSRMCKIFEYQKFYSKTQTRCKFDSSAQPNSIYDVVKKHEEFLIPIEACTISLLGLACQVFGATVCANNRSSWPSVLHFPNGKYCTWTGLLEGECSCINLQLKTPPETHFWFRPNPGALKDPVFASEVWHWCFLLTPKL